MTPVYVSGFRVRFCDLMQFCIATILSWRDNEEKRISNCSDDLFINSTFSLFKNVPDKFASRWVIAHGYRMRKVAFTLVRFMQYASSFYSIWSIFTSLKPLNLLRKTHQCELLELLSLNIPVLPNTMPRLSIVWWSFPETLTAFPNQVSSQSLCGVECNTLMCKWYD